MRHNSMKLVAASAMALTVALLIPSLGAQVRPAKKRAHLTSITGCVVKGDEPNEVMLEAKNGKTYGLESSRIKLAAHLGHTVTVTGSVRAAGKEEAGEAAKEAKTTAKPETADFRVRTLKMVSKTCQS